MAEVDRKRITGKTWSVYLYIVTSEKPQGVREIWRKLKLSTPSLVQYHINKLLDMKLIETTLDGKYRADEMEHMGVLRGFVKMRGRLIPRLVFYNALLGGMLFAYLLFWPFRWDFRDLTVLFVTVLSIIAFSFEAYNQYKGLLDK
jgi:hypothetical protein